MMRFLGSIVQLKILLPLVVALAVLTYAFFELTGVIKDDVAVHQDALDADKAAAEKVKKIMTYDPSKARLVDP